MAAVEKTNSQLVSALTSGRIPVLQLPGGLGLCSAAAAAAGVSRQGSGISSRVLQAGLAAGSDISSSTSSSSEQGEQVQWGLGALLQQLQAAQDAVQVSGAATPELVQPAAAAAATVAASLLQQLAPTTSSHTHQYQQQHQAQQQQHPYLLSHHGGTGAGTSAAAAQRPCCVCVDLHKAWMAELSPRLKLKGLGYSAMYSPGHSGSGGIAGTNNAAAAAAALAELPQELLAAWQALQAALAFCKRNTTSSSSSSGGSGSATGRSQRHSSSGGKRHEANDAGGGKQLWFGLMDVYVARMRSIPHNTAASSASAAPSHTQQQQQQQQQSQQQLAVSPQLLESLAAAAAGQLGPAALSNVLLSAASAVASCVAHDVFSLLLDEVVCVMADHLPLLDIVGRVLQQHGSERFGEFRSTLLGLFGATAYESAIMQAANRWGGVTMACWLAAA
jgi:hypothetical protein